MGQFVADEAVILDPDKVEGAVSRCVEALYAIGRFEATNESQIVRVSDHTQTIRFGRVYPAGYVEDLIAEIKAALTGGVDAEADTD